MVSKLNGSEEAVAGPAAPRRFPYSNWGPWAALIGLFIALVAAGVVAVPVTLIDNQPSADELSAAANVVIQFAQELAFLIVPFALAMLRGRGERVDFREAARRLGLRRFKPSALLTMLGAYALYIVFIVAYTAAFGEPHQKDIAEELGPLGVQIALIAVAAPICEEVCFRGMLFAGMRERLPGFAAALVSGLVFGALHATTGVSAVPPLVVLGAILALLYERTGSIVPGILLHMMNNAIVVLSQ
jgi:membrane protease YdiL (CAAX protease family)